MASDGKKGPDLGILIGTGKKPHGMSDDESSEDMSEGDDEYSEELTDVADELADAFLTKERGGTVGPRKHSKP